MDINISFVREGVPESENKMRRGTSIEVRTPEEIETMRESCKVCSLAVMDLSLLSIYLHCTCCMTFVFCLR